jgi:hypothetical protein
MNEKNVMDRMTVQMSVKKCTVEIELKIIEKNVILQILHMHDGDLMDVMNSVNQNLIQMTHVQKHSNEH